MGTGRGTGGGGEDPRAVRLEGAPRAGVVGDDALLVPRAAGRLEEGVLGGRLVDEVGDPGVPAGVDLGAAGDGQYLHRSSDFLGVCPACALSWYIRVFGGPRGREGCEGEGRTSRSRAWRTRPSGCGLSHVSIPLDKGTLETSTYAAARPCSRRTCCPLHPSRRGGRTWCRLLPLTRAPLSVFLLRLLNPMSQRDPGTYRCTIVSKRSSSIACR